MIDFHSHILPGIDDGSRSTETSVKMLEKSAEQGVTVIALTPHFYADNDTPERFLKRRNESFKELQNVSGSRPRLLKGAEVYYFPGLQHCEEISSLRLEGTPYLLLEMPFHTWSERIIDDVSELNQRRDLQVVLAHIDRYIAMQKKGVIEALLENGIMLQANAESLLSRRSKRKILKLIKQGSVSFLGSDCHNLTSRAPCIGEAVEVLRKSLGAESADKFIKNSEALFFESETEF